MMCGAWYRHVATICSKFQIHPKWQNAQKSNEGQGICPWQVRQDSLKQQEAFCLTISSEICFIGKEIAVMSCDVTLWHVMAYDGMWCEGMSCSGNWRRPRSELLSPFLECQIPKDFPWELGSFSRLWLVSFCDMVWFPIFYQIDFSDPSGPFHLSSSKVTGDFATFNRKIRKPQPAAEQVSSGCSLLWGDLLSSVMPLGP